LLGVVAGDANAQGAAGELSDVFDSERAPPELDAVGLYGERDVKAAVDDERSAGIMGDAPKGFREVEEVLRGQVVLSKLHCVDAGLDGPLDDAGEGWAGQAPIGDEHQSKHVSAL